MDTSSFSLEVSFTGRINLCMSHDGDTEEPVSVLHIEIPPEDPVQKGTSHVNGSIPEKPPPEWAEVPLHGLGSVATVSEANKGLYTLAVFRPRLYRERSPGPYSFRWPFSLLSTPRIRPFAATSRTSLRR